VTSILHTAAPSIARDVMHLAIRLRDDQPTAVTAMVHCTSRAQVDRLAAVLGLPPAAVKRSQYMSYGGLGRVEVHVMCPGAETRQERRERLTRELAELDAEVADATH